ncbi:GntR family transcriptional regulator [Enterobacter hormaechei]|uniref:GntR family transcriptional regulator n=1 Tax=Enterobacter hormaechei TaxID=158836 RepID=UPI003510A970
MKPGYHEIYSRYRDNIMRGVLKPGDRVPAIRVLAEELKVARKTVETAYAILTGEGYVVSLREGFDLSTPVGKAMLTMMAGLASLEKDLIAERRAAGIKRAQSEGKHCGRPIKATVEQVRELLARGLPPAAIQDRLEISKATFYRLKSFLQLSDI